MHWGSLSQPFPPPKSTPTAPQSKTAHLAWCLQPPAKRWTSVTLSDLSHDQRETEKKAGTDAQVVDMVAHLPCVTSQGGSTLVS